MEKYIEFKNLTRLSEVSSDYSQIEDSYLFSHITPESGRLAELLDAEPMKLDGALLLLVFSGSPVEIEVNMERYSISPGTFMYTFPNSVFKLRGHVPDDVDMYVMFFDHKFMQSININLSSIAIPPMLQKPEPAIKLDDAESDLLRRYFELLHANTIDRTNMQINKSIASSLTSAMFYQLVQFFHKRLTGEIVEKTHGKEISGRRHDYVREFVRLVHRHYVHERSVSFYADKLFISPKYLSLLVKEATGRSAAKWIDDFVLMEAKNMLRFSGKNIQQVAYSLNFPTQSSFGKYFKHLTGMSPTEYQKS